MREMEIEDLLREYMSFQEEISPRTFIGGGSREYFLETEPWGKSYMRGRILEKVVFPGSEIFFFEVVGWTYGKRRKTVLTRLLSELSDGKSPEEASLELTSTGRNGMMKESCADTRKRPTSSKRR